MKSHTAGELKQRLIPHLLALKDDDLVTFGGGLLSLYRPQLRGPTRDGHQLLDIEFNEVFNIQVDPDLLDN